jgi:hypothetical protein
MADDLVNVDSVVGDGRPAEEGHVATRDGRPSSEGQRVWRRGRLLSLLTMMVAQSHPSSSSECGR